MQFCADPLKHFPSTGVIPATLKKFLAKNFAGRQVGNRMDPDQAPLSLEESLAVIPMYPPDPPAFVPLQSNYCGPHFARGGVELPAVRDVNGEGFCKKCFAGRDLRPTKIRGEDLPAPPAVAKAIITRSCVRCAALFTPRGRQRYCTKDCQAARRREWHGRYWQEHQAEIRAWRSDPARKERELQLQRDRRAGIAAGSERRRAASR